MNDEGGRKKVGRPDYNKSGRINGSGKFYGKCDVRLTKEKDLKLSRLADRYGITRSDVMRLALDDLLRFNGLDEE